MNDDSGRPNNVGGNSSIMKDDKYKWSDITRAGRFGRNP